MRLLQLQADGEIRFAQDQNGDNHPYAILSHTWGDIHEEVTFNDLIAGTGTTKPGFQKIRFCGEQAARDGLHRFWVDTCCIDKTNSTELGLSINSMFHWYKNSARCYVWLSDVPGDIGVPWESAFRSSRWFTRGWTLQELLAPSSVEFFSIERRLGDKKALERHISQITSIPVSALRSSNLSSFTVKERLGWARNRTTTHPEDKCYSLLGVFGIYLPLIYGEGKDHAFRRLREEIKKAENFERDTLTGAAAGSPEPPHQTQINQELRYSLAETQRIMQSQLAEIFNVLRANGLSTGEEDGQENLVIVGSATEASLAFSEIARCMNILNQAYSEDKIANRSQASGAQWLQLQLESVWAVVQAKSAAQLRNKRRRTTSAWKNISGSTPNTEARDMGKQFNSIIRKRKSATESSSVEITVPGGQVQLRVVSGSQSGKLLGIRLLFAPAPVLRPNIKGLVMTCMKQHTLQPIPRYLSTFQVHSENSEALVSIRTGNLNAVRKLLTLQKIRPTDRDEDGDSLLMISIVERQYKISELLLNQGADPLDCDRYCNLEIEDSAMHGANDYSEGNSALCCFLNERSAYGNVEDTRLATGFDMESIGFAIRLFARHCGTDTGLALEHLTDLGESVGESFVPPIHQAMDHFTDPVADVLLFLPIRLIIGECDLEEVDGFGRSALLASVEGVKRSQFAELASLLLLFGARPFAVDNGNSGILHYILRTTSACNKAHTQVELFEPIKDLLVILLLRGCDPSAVDEDGTTPSELALSTSAWLLWCDALNTANMDLLDVLREDDRIHNVVLNSAVLDREYNNALSSASLGRVGINNGRSPLERNPRICDNCDSSHEWAQMRIPFDCHGSYLVSMGQYFAHAMVPNHTDGSFCDNGESRSSCRHKCHWSHGDNVYWSRRSLSLRKHIAYRLWKNRVLTNAAQAYAWATGVEENW